MSNAHHVLPRTALRVKDKMQRHYYYYSNYFKIVQQLKGGGEFLEFQLKQNNRRSLLERLESLKFKKMKLKA